MITRTSGNVLSTEQLARTAPAIFAAAPHASVSEKYSFVPTSTVVDALQGAGWAPMFAAQGRAKDITRAGVQRHVVRFRHSDARLDVGDVFPELVLVNSHDASSAFQLHAGVFRLVCGNGMVVADSTFAKISIRHSHVTPAEIIDASFKVVADVPKLSESINGMRAVQLTAGEQEAFAGAAAVARWGDEVQADPRSLLTARRYDDKGGDLWTTFNRVQENLVRGGVRGTTAEGKRRRVRAVASVTEDTRLNKALWHLAEEFRRMKAA
jgi:hypothetical protein